jgi:tripeptide aminopeptidase
VAVLDLFLELASISSPPGEERAVADRVLDELRGFGAQVEEDDAGGRIGSSAGNLLCRLEGTVDAGLPIFLCAHLDTVPPTGRIEPVVEDGVVRNTGGTILGADDKSAVAVMVEAARRLLEEQRPHAGVELLFTPKEEVGLLGAQAFDTSRLASRIGFVFDQAAPIGEIVLGAPSAVAINFLFTGRAAHAGMYPEDGRSAVAAAARAIADFRLGRVDDESTANVGRIEGGDARNIVPAECRVTAEARSHDEARLADLVREMTETAAFAAALEGCEVETEIARSYRAYRFKPDDVALRLAEVALEESGFTPSFVLSGGGADANVLNERGLSCLNLANGMMEIHTPQEHIAVADLEAMVEVTLALVEAARVGPT